MEDTPTPLPAWQEPTPKDVALKSLCPRYGSETLAGSLRITKGALIALEYRNAAAEGRFG